MKNSKKILLIMLLSILLIVGGIVIKNFIDRKQQENLIEEIIKKINYSIEQSDIENAFINVQKLEDVSNNNEKLISLKYDILLACNKELSDYDICIKLFSDLKDYKDTKDMLIDYKYNYAMKIKESNENEAISILKEISHYKNANELIEDYNFRHRFDGTYFYVFGDIESAVEGNPSERIVINGLDIETSYIWYGYFSSDLYNSYSKTTYYKGRGRTRNRKMTCNEDLTICKTFLLTSVDEDGYYEETFDENAKNLYRIETYKFEKDLITESTHYITKKYDFDKDSTTTYKKINNDTELPEESKPTEYPKDPKIGMTKEEVERSTWGYPKKINKDTYSWGTQEQWVYDKGYIYFRDGVVTSISER